MIDVFGLLVVSMMNSAGAGRVPDHMLFLALNKLLRRECAARRSGSASCAAWSGSVRLHLLVGVGVLHLGPSEPGGLAAPASYCVIQYILRDPVKTWGPVTGKGLIVWCFHSRLSK